jgi:hypothetical protein
MSYESVQFQSLGAEMDMDNRVLRGYVVAIQGDFKDERGAFSEEGLSQIVRIMGTGKGLKSRFGHPGLLTDGLGRFLGRGRKPRMDSVVNWQGKRVPAVRADLHFDESAFKTPYGDLATYVMTLAKSDPDAISSSLVIAPRLQDRGRDQPPLWFPNRLAASDIVEEGDAVDSLLTSFPEAKVIEMLDGFVGNSDERLQVIANYCQAWKESHPGPELPGLAERRDKMAAMAVAAKQFGGKPNG